MELELSIISHKSMQFSITSQLFLIKPSMSMRGIPYHSVVVSSWSITPETIGPRIIARPCPANPNDTNLTPKYSVGIMVLLSAFYGTNRKCHSCSNSLNFGYISIQNWNITISSSLFAGETIVGKLGP